MNNWCDDVTVSGHMKVTMIITCKNDTSFDVFNTSTIKWNRSSGKSPQRQRRQSKPQADAFCRLSRTEVWLWASLLIRAQELGLVLMSLLIRSCCFMTLPPQLPSLNAVNGFLFGLLDAIPVVSALLVLEHDGHVASGVQVASCDVDNGAPGYGTAAGLQRVQSGDLWWGGGEDMTSYSISFSLSDHFSFSHNPIGGAMKAINSWIKVISKE